MQFEMHVFSPLGNSLRKYLDGITAVLYCQTFVGLMLPGVRSVITDRINAADYAIASVRLSVCFLNFQSPASYGRDLLTSKSSRSRSVGSEDRAKTNGRTDGGDCCTSFANAVGICGNHTIEAVHDMLVRCFICELADDSLNLSAAYPICVNANEWQKDQACSTGYGSLLKPYDLS